MYQNILTHLLANKEDDVFCLAVSVNIYDKMEKEACNEETEASGVQDARDNSTRMYKHSHMKGRRYSEQLDQF